jgi:phenylpyruvate tautomerase PptA (4-oxalocrotonate tautomerase family)
MWPDIVRKWAVTEQNEGACPPLLAVAGRAAHHPSRGNNMPVYQCYSPKGLLTKSAKAKIAEQITSIYCNATGASELWVNVLFHEIPEGECFVAGKPATKSYIFGLNRHGRDLETRRTLLRQISQMWTRVTGQPEADLWVSVTEIDHTNVREAGLFFPEPGRDREWFEENRARLAELGITAA